MPGDASFCAVVQSQMEAGLWMPRRILTACPDGRWDAPVGIYPFWAVAYHVLCFVDVYAAPDNDSWTPDPTMHPLGREELEREHPSRRFEREELVSYLDRCRSLVRRSLAAETDDSPAGPSGFGHLPFSRAELHLDSLRHLQHHTGQFSAHLRRAGIATSWPKRGTEP